jgi:hypothetical protein
LRRLLASPRQARGGPEDAEESGLTLPNLTRPEFSDADLENRTQLLARLDNGRDALENAFSNWGDLSDVQKDQALKQTVRVVAAMFHSFIPLREQLQTRWAAGAAAGTRRSRERK